MGGSSGGGGSAPANTTANNTNTVINDVPAWEQQYMTNLLGQATTEAAQPYSQFPGQQVAGFTPDQTNAFSNIENLVGSGAAANTGAAATGQATAGANTANTISGAGSPWLQASAMYNPAAAAAPYTAAAANTATPQGISSYMSPYLNNQIQGLQTLAQQNWNQFTAPGVNNEFISSGQAGSGRNEQVLGQQANLANQALTAQIANADQNAYTTAGQQAATQAGILGNAGNTAGSTAQAEAANLQNIGTGLGNLAATQAGAQGAAASNLANTANTVQNTGITGASALQAVGQQQQNLAQQNINTAETNFQNQTMWPETQTSFLSDILRGLPTTGGASTSAGQTPTTTNMIGSTSPLGSLAGSLIGAGGVAAGGGIKAKRGGLIQHLMRGGSVKGYDDGGPVTVPDNLDMGLLSQLLPSNGNDQPPDNSGIAIDAPAPPQLPLPQDTSSQFNPPPDLMAAATSTAQNALPKTSNPSPDISPLPQGEAPETSNHMPSETPLSSAVESHSDAKSDYQEPGGGSISSYMGMKPLDENKMRQYQLLSMAKGLLTPAHSGAEALGNAFGNYAQTGADFMKMQQEAQQRALQFESLNNYRMNRNDVSQQRADTAQQLADAKTNNQGMGTGQVQQLASKLQAEDKANGNPVLPLMAYISKANSALNGNNTNAPIPAPQGSVTMPAVTIGGNANIDPQTGDVTPPTFGFNTSNIPPKVFSKWADEDSAQRKTALTNMPLASNILNTLDELEPNFKNVDTGGYTSKIERIGAKSLNHNGQYNTSASNIDKGTNALATDIGKFQYTPGNRGSVLGLQTILASKPSMDQPEQTNYNVTNGIRARVNDYMLTQDLAQQWRNASPLKITDSNTYAVDEALKTIYPLQSTDPKTGVVTFNKDNAAKIKAAIPEAIANPKKYFDMAVQAGGNQSQGAPQQRGGGAPALTPEQIQAIKLYRQKKQLQGAQ